jgi:multidrug efflux pump subunit AcrA (membrane-fusion protein)
MFASWLFGLFPGSVLFALPGFPATGNGLVQDLNKVTASQPDHMEVAGRTQCILNRKCSIAPVPLHPVIEVLIEPGARVKKGQVLIKLDDDEPRADVRVKQKALENAKILAKQASRYLGSIEESFHHGALPEHRYYEVRVAALKAGNDEQAAEAALESAKAELEHYQVTALIDGIVSWLDVHPGLVSRPGTTVWGEILDLRELDVRCELPPEQADRVGISQIAEIRRNGKDDLLGTGRIVCVGIAVNKAGLVPVIVRVSNSEGRLRAEESVRVRFGKCSSGG